jgi:Leucine-rich repeat (LRR) protein
MLDLSDNEIEELGERICSLTSLRVLILSNNPLRELPDCIFESNLEILSIVGCKMDSVPYGVTKMTNLKMLAIAGNNFSRNYLNQLQIKMPNVQIITGID